VKSPSVGKCGPQPVKQGLLTNLILYSSCHKLNFKKPTLYV